MACTQCCAAAVAVSLPLRTASFSDRGLSAGKVRHRALAVSRQSSALIGTNLPTVVPVSSLKHSRGPAPATALLEQAQSVAVNALPPGAVDALAGAVSTVADYVPASITQPVASFVSYYSALPEDQQLNAAVFGALAFLYLTTRPSVLLGILDSYLLAPLDRAADILRDRRYATKELKVLRRLGEGSFGTVFEMALAETADRKRPTKFILKRVKGSMEAQECGEVEDYMNRRLRRGVPGISANYLGCYTNKKDNAFYLAWSYQGDSTIDALFTREFPDNVAPVFLRGPLAPRDRNKRRRDVVRIIMKRVLSIIARMHSTGIVHRDIKPSNFIVTDKGQVLLIDLGAAVDLRAGVNYIPERAMLDPDYCPPEQLVMDNNTPAPPPKLLAKLLSPILWQLKHPDVFDTYSAGIMLMQMCLPSLRNRSGLDRFNREIRRYDYDMRAWRKDSKEDFTLLDMDFGAGWDLACKLICRRGELLPGRLNAEEALRHRFFLSLPGF